MPGTAPVAYARVFNDWVTLGTTTSTTFQYVWDAWATTNLTTTGTYAAANHLWVNWNTTTTTNAVMIWETWTEGSASPVYTARPVRQPVHQRPPGGQLIRTEAEWAAIAAENERLQAARLKDKEDALRAARQLLEFVLTPEQLASYDTHGSFEVVGSHGTLYRVRRGTAGNITQIVNGKEVSVLCAHPVLLDHEGRGYLPTDDSVAAQVLALKVDETELVQVAYVHRGRRHLAVVRDEAAA